MKLTDIDQNLNEAPVGMLKRAATKLKKHTPFAAGNRARIVRKVKDKDVEIKLNLDDLLNKGDLGENVEVQPGDVLVVPQSYF